MNEWQWTIGYGDKKQEQENVNNSLLAGALDPVNYIGQEQHNNNNNKRTQMTAKNY